MACGSRFKTCNFTDRPNCRDCRNYYVVTTKLYLKTGILNNWQQSPFQDKLGPYQTNGKGISRLKCPASQNPAKKPYLIIENRVIELTWPERHAFRKPRINLFDIAITLSVGEKSCEDYALWKDTSRIFALSACAHPQRHIN